MSVSPRPSPARPVRFFHRGAVVELPTDTPATRSVLDWLREDARCTGTKEGCNEGDCGACTVVLGSLDEAGALSLKPVNACIQFLPTLDGQALFTVEDVAPAEGTLHPVQQCLVQHHGSQCGFCTPGIVMSLWCGWQRHAAAGTVPSRQMLADDLSGNLCRCTGYRPILDAAQAAYAQPAAAFDATAVVAALRALRDDGPPAAAGFHAPRSVAELAATLLAEPGARILAGSTDIGLWVNKQFRDLPSLVYTGRVPELAAVAVRDGVLSIGAAVPLEAAWRALVERWPALRDLWLRFASLPIREAGTMGGNVANGSPIGDSAPVLMALRATLLLQRGSVQRRLALDAFYTGYMSNRLEPGEFLHSIEVPLDEPQRTVHAYKISKRFDCDISALCLGASFERREGLLHGVRLAWGGMAATVQRAAAAEAAMEGQAWDEATAEAAAAALAQDFKPLTDMRASADYRLQVAGNLIRRLWLQTRSEDPLPEHATSVWARGHAAEGVS
jgi:xanthine dehydrogenase small subunit